MLALLLLLAVQPPPPHMYWMWEFPADLRQRPLQGAGAAFLLATAEKQEQRLVWRMRRQPLQLPPNTYRMAVIRLTVNPREGERSLNLIQHRVAIAARIVSLAKQSGAPALQIDADIAPPQASSYLQLLTELRQRLPNTFLSVTANTSWCRPGTWVDQAPVDEVVPMLFVRGSRSEAPPPASLSPRCRPSIGLIPSHPPPAEWSHRRVYFFVTGLSDFGMLFPK